MLRGARTRLRVQVAHEIVLANGRTSRATQSYNTVTAHSINEEWELKSYVLCTSVMSESHTSTKIPYFHGETVNYWGLQKVNKIVCTTDSVANVTDAVTQAGLMNICCYTHCLNLATQKGLQVSAVSRLPTATATVIEMRMTIANNWHSRLNIALF